MLDVCEDMGCELFGFEEAGDAVFVPAAAYHCGSDGGGEGGSVIVSVGLRSRWREPAALRKQLHVETARWRGCDFFTGVPAAEDPGPAPAAGGAGS